MFKKAAVVIPAVAGAVSMYAPLVAHAADGDAASAATDAVGVVTAIVPLFTTYPMNVFIGCGIAAAGLGLFARARKSSGGKG